jgi:hypothetical protein
VEEKVLCRFAPGFSIHLPSSCVLTSDGGQVIATGTDSASPKGQKREQILIWDVAEYRDRAARLMKKPPSRDWDKRVEALFKQRYLVEEPDLQKRRLAYEDMAAANRAMVALAAYPEKAPGLLARKLGPPLDRKQVLQWIQDLDSSSFPKRQEAVRQLARRGGLVEPYLKQALASKTTLEQKKRLEGLLKEVEGKKGAEEFGWLRALDVLEHVNTKEARKLLQAIAAGSYGPVYQESARGAWRRLRQRP